MIWDFLRKKKRFQGLTIGMVFSNTCQKSLQISAGESRREVKFTDDLMEIILAQGGLPLPIDLEGKEISEDPQAQKDVLQRNPQASLLLCGAFHYGKYTNNDNAFWQVTFRCITRNGTIVGASNFFISGGFVQQRSEAAKKVLQLIHVESLGKIDPNSGYQEKLFTNGHRSVVEETS